MPPAPRSDILLQSTVIRWHLVLSDASWRMMVSRQIVIFDTPRQQEKGSTTTQAILTAILASIVFLVFLGCMLYVGGVLPRLWSSGAATTHNSQRNTANNEVVWMSPEQRGERNESHILRNTPLPTIPLPTYLQTVGPAPPYSQESSNS
ncbi:hypothetical protein M422DRAFT_24472 [Sphaerobolus stellatus SS14]|nr:hypothetical protein M422DRAFT_24472 [Sphaerobolus stellatus SS14]